MVNDQLEAIIREEFRNGKRRDEIRSELVEQGWELGDVDHAISTIQRDALKQMPGIATVVKKMEELEKKTSNASPRMIATVLAVCVFIVLGIFFVLYVSLDPLGTKSAARDQERETDFIKIHNSISKYHSETGKYPTSLNDLIPTYLQSLPLDPKSGAAYAYKSVSDGYNYELCVSFETKAGQCVSSGATDDSIPQVIDSSGQEQAVESSTDTNAL